MMRLLLKMLLLPPDLLKSHAQGYVDLASEVGARYLCTLKNRWVMYALSVLTLLLALIFGGMALLLCMSRNDAQAFAKMIPPGDTKEVFDGPAFEDDNRLLRLGVMTSPVQIRWMPDLRLQ